jgi:RimJ/RimL family protein N-acetyltransferase
VSSVPAFDLQPVLRGPTLTLRPLLAGDFDALLAAASDPLVWEQHPQPTRWRREVFAEHFFAGALASGSAFVVLDNASGAIIGSSRYYDWQPQTREIAIGYTFLIREKWGGTSNQEMKQLMLEHAWHWADTVWFHIGAQNLRSRRALEKLGGRFSHEQMRGPAGASSLTVFYRIDAPPRHA